MRTVESVLSEVSEALTDARIDDPRLEAEFLLSSLLAQPRTRLLLNRKDPWDARLDRKLSRWVLERRKRKPFAYIVGEQPFGDLIFQVNRRVLVPRPETELLVEAARRVLDRWTRPVTVVDVGTGSGNIALSLVAHPKVARTIGIDISLDALTIARENARLHSQERRVEWRHGSLLEPIVPRDHPIGLITANLPYIRTDVMANLEPELHYEPRVALDGGVDGLRLIEPCLQQAAQILATQGTLLLEIGFDQGEAVYERLLSNGSWKDIDVLLDYAQHPRLVRAVRKG